MNDINHLIHSNARLAFEQGRLEERRVAVQILRQMPAQFARKDEVERAIRVAIKRLEQGDYLSQKTENDD